MKLFSKASRENICKYFQEYTENTAIHGVKFIGDRKRSILERYRIRISNFTATFSITKTLFQDSMVDHLDNFSGSLFEIRAADL